MEKVKEMIDEGAYFVVYAPRQMGKTTLLENMRTGFLRKPVV